ncbi:hypothetical protein ACWM58_26645 (plasmid) [Klebsiella quasipneumoniae]
MTIMKVHYSPTDGIPLNSLYLKETSTTERSGSVLGGGISGDSVILGGGGYAGSEMQKTTRSSVFAPPDEVTAEPDNTKMVLRISCVIGVMFLLIIITLFSNAVVDIFDVNVSKEGANKRGNSSRLTQSFHFFMFEPIFSPVNALNQPI